MKIGRILANCNTHRRLSYGPPWGVLVQSNVKQVNRIDSFQQQQKYIINKKRTTNLAPWQTDIAELFNSNCKNKKTKNVKTCKTMEQ